MRTGRPWCCTRCTRCTRNGLTVVEVLVALVVVTVGLLGMAGTSALSIRSAAALGRERRALGRVDLRLAVLAAGGCPGAASGTAADPRDDLHEWWTVAAPVHGVALVDVGVDWRDGARRRSISERSAILC